MSMASTVWQTILLSILSEGKTDLSEEHLQDIALLLVDKQKAISAQVPVDMKKLCKVIKQSEKWRELTNLPPKKMAVWMQINCPEAFSLLEDITRRYAHRNVKELDLMTTTWGLDNTPLLSMIQTLLRSEHSILEKETIPEVDTDVVDKLRSPRKSTTRWLICWLAGLASSAAARREMSKDASLRVVHQLRLGYMRLATLMAQEGRLPTPQLVWYCTHYELGTLLGPSNPALLHKISRRQRSWQQWDELQFPEVMVGTPEPIQLGSHPTITSREWVQGTLVCTGSVQGRVCVLLSCTDTQSLQAGDILITHSTDVGWTPLFPLLSGVVTELGGLISHGAVVAREYGLPCIVGATNATLVFKTGDKVFMDGKSGRIHKVFETS
ncbi:uncharacterized protein Mb2073c-like [Macrosteles quadrilineatus]|uniref:uncharacterized protein Mb2073c-like n=1 Tax=Macrosteles quadrilineatus TaxID=74068 RepID=UPI0023E25F76|nr:uncharacterized protein Mb2073c-like [Macrosteles quadrilineatus]